MYQHNAHLFTLRLVGHEQSQLVEGSTYSLPTLAAANCDLLRNPVQVFEHECPMPLFGLLDKPLADLVVDLALKAGLFPGKLTQAPAGACCPSGGAGDAESGAHGSRYVCATVLLAVRVGGKVHHTETDAKHTKGFVAMRQRYALGRQSRACSQE